jgi:hypothetical protein
MAEVAECLPSKHDAFSSNPSTAKKKKKKPKTFFANINVIQPPDIHF